MNKFFILGGLVALFSGTAMADEPVFKAPTFNYGRLLKSVMTNKESEIEAPTSILSGAKSLESNRAPATEASIDDTTSDLDGGGVGESVARLDSHSRSASVTPSNDDGDSHVSGGGAPEDSYTSDAIVHGYNVSACERKMVILAKNYCDKLWAAEAEINTNPGTDVWGRSRRALRDARQGSKFYRAKLGLKGIGSRVENAVAFLSPDNDGANYKYARCNKRGFLGKIKPENNQQEWAEQFCRSPFNKHPIYSIADEMKNMHKTSSKALKRVSKVNVTAAQNVDDALNILEGASNDPDLRSIDEASRLAHDYERPTRKIGRAFGGLWYNLTHPISAIKGQRPSDGGRFGDAELNRYSNRRGASASSLLN